MTRLGRLDEAIDHLRQAIQLRPGYIEAHSRLGTALVQAGRFQEAIAEYEQLLHSAPMTSWSTTTWQMRWLKPIGFRRPSIITSKRCCFKPDYPQANNNLGIALVRFGRQREAAECFQRALTLNPKNPEAHYNLANILFTSDRLPEAIEHYKLALKIDPQYPDVLRNLGSAMVKIGRPAEAIDYYRQSLQLEPDVVSVYYNMAVAYVQIRRSSEAIAAAQKAIELARTQGQSAQAKKIEDWLNSYRAELSIHPSTSPAP